MLCVYLDGAPARGVSKGERELGAGENADDFWYARSRPMLEHKTLNKRSAGWRDSAQPKRIIHTPVVYTSTVATDAVRQQQQQQARLPLATVTLLYDRNISWWTVKSFQKRDFSSLFNKMCDRRRWTIWGEKKKPVKLASLCRLSRNFLCPTAI